MYLEVGDKMKKLLLFLCVFLLSCEDTRVEEQPEENIQMWVNGSEIIAREYYESITTYGASSVPTPPLQNCFEKTHCFRRS